MARCFSAGSLIFVLLAALWLAPATPSAADEPQDHPAAKAIPKADSPDKAAPEEKSPKPDEEYYELLKVFADALDQIDRNYVKRISRRELMEGAIRGMLSKLDPHSAYIAPKEVERFKSGVENEFGGIGIQVSTENGRLIIISPLIGSPAYRAGLMAGDRIVKIEGHQTQGITIDEAVHKLKGKVGTKVTFTVVHPHDGSTQTVTIQRAIVRVETVMGDRRKDDDSWDFMYDRDKRIGYVRVTAFSRHTAEDLRKALEELQSQKMRALILDLRFNPGGLLPAAVEVSDLFISKGRIVSTAGRNVPERIWDAHQAGTFEGFPMAVLVNRYSASASEIVSACLQDHDRAVIIGERTWGKGSVQNVIELERGKSILKLTTAGYQRPSGKKIDRLPDDTEKDEWGVHPDDGFEVVFSHAENGRLLMDRRERDIIVSEKQPEPKADEPEMPEFVDRQLQKAIKYLTEELKRRAKEKEAKPKEQKSENKQ